MTKRYTITIEATKSQLEAIDSFYADQWRNWDNGLHAPRLSEKTFKSGVDLLRQIALQGYRAESKHVPIPPGAPKKVWKNPKAQAKATLEFEQAKENIFDTLEEESEDFFEVVAFGMRLEKSLVTELFNDIFEACREVIEQRVLEAEAAYLKFADSDEADSLLFNRVISDEVRRVGASMTVGRVSLSENSNE